MNKAGAFGVLFFVCGITGCVAPDDKPPAVLAEGCILNSDCAGDLVCAFRRCHNQCETDQDCKTIEAQTSCVPTDRPYKVCLLRDESSCLYNTDCPNGLRCARDLHCRLECRLDADCVSGQVCSQGACAAPSELVDGGLVSVLDAGAPIGTTTCLYSSECPDPLVCIGGACREECLTKRDCTPGASCDKGTCALDAQVQPDGGTVYGDGGFPTGWGADCVLNGECPASLVCTNGRCAFECLDARDCGSTGACCFANHCARGDACVSGLPDGGFDGGSMGGSCRNDLDCDDQDFCNGIELCVNRVCRRSIHAVCDDSNPCTTDACNPTSRTCSYSMAANTGDADGDGHYDVTCGTGGDDCDDSDPNTFFGHPELCDQRDNNCNGAVDEGLWHERIGARGSIDGNERYPWWAGAPSIVRTDAGVLIAVSSDTIDGKLELFKLSPQLNLLQGPVQLFGSTTQWTSPPGQSQPFGRRLVYPKLYADHGLVLASATVASTAGATTCAGDDWVVEVPVIEVNQATLQVQKRWQSVSIDGTSAQCPSIFNPENYALSSSLPALAWSPNANRWVVAWRKRVNGVSQVTTASFDADGGLQGVHELFPGAGANIYVDNVEWAGEPPVLTRVDGRMAIIYVDSAKRGRSVFTDPQLNAPLSPANFLTEIGSYIDDVAGMPGDLGFRTIETTASNLDSRVIEYDADGGVALGPFQLPHVFAREDGAPNAIGLTQERRASVARTHDGYFVATADEPNLKFSFISTRNDGGVVSLFVPMDANRRSRVRVVPIDDTSVGLIWVDGRLKRTIVECTP